MKLLLAAAATLLVALVWRDAEAGPKLDLGWNEFAWRGQRSHVADAFPPHIQPCLLSLWQWQAQGQRWLIWVPGTTKHDIAYLEPKGLYWANWACPPKNLDKEQGQVIIQTFSGPRSHRLGVSWLPDRQAVWYYVPHPSQETGTGRGWLRFRPPLEQGVRAGAERWNAEDFNFTLVYGGKTQPTKTLCEGYSDGKNTVSYRALPVWGWMCGKVVGGKFVEVDIELLLDWRWDVRQVEGVACHEFSHFLGLGHLSGDTSTLKAIPRPEPRCPSAHDIEELQAIYGRRMR